MGNYITVVGVGYGKNAVHVVCETVHEGQWA